jgi:hypothetical protein
MEIKYLNGSLKIEPPKLAELPLAVCAPVGGGMGRNEHLFRGRPCNTQRSYGNQKLQNGRFQSDDNGNAFDDAR